MWALWIWMGLQDPPQPEPPKKQPDKGKTVVISAPPLRERDPFLAPMNIDVLKSKDLQERESRTLPEAMKEMPNVSVQKTSHGHGSPFIRGFTGFRNVMLIDDIRLNASFFREGPNQYWNTVDAYLIDQMEIIRGPASVLYGSDAMGGAVNVFTKRRESFESGFHMQGHSIARVASAEQSVVGRHEIEGNQDRFGWFVGVTGRNYGEIIAGEHVGTQHETDYAEWSGDAKFSLLPATEHRFDLAVQTARQFDVPRTHATIFREHWQGVPAGVPADDRVREFDQERDLVYARYEWRPTGGVIEALSVTASLHRHAETFTIVRANNTIEFREFTATIPGITVRAGAPSPIGFLTVGTEYYHEDVQSDGYNTTTAGTVSFLGRGEIADNSEYDLFGFFIQDEIEVFKGLFITLGGRFTWAHLNADGVALAPGSRTTGNVVVNPFLTGLASIDDEYQAVVGDFRILYEATGQVVVFGGVSQSFRAPGLDDTTSFRLRTGGQSLDLPSPGLDPERGVQFEAGGRFRDGRWQFEVVGFYTFLDDLIRRFPTVDIDGNGSIDSPKANFSEGRVYGVEITGQIPFGEDFTLWGGFAWVEGFSEVSDAGGTPTRPLGKVNPMTGILKLRYEPPKAPFWIEGVVLMVATQDHLSPDDRIILTTNPPSGDTRIPPGGTPGFTVFTLRGGYRFNDQVSATLALENLTNKDYRFHGSGQHEPGFNIVAGIDLRY
jgi:hemoglobin/transferrin/lactoferrin receptor protein